MTQPAGIGVKALFFSVSLVLATLLWGYVKGTQPLNVRYAQVPIQLLNSGGLPANLIIGSLVPDKAWIGVSGPEDILPDALNDIENRGVAAAYVDLTGAHAGTDEYPLRLAVKRGLPYQVSLQDESMKVTIEQKDDVKLPITVEESGQIPPEKDLAFNGATPTPSIATVSGPIGLVRMVKKVRAFLDLSKVDSSANLPIKLESLDERDQPVTGVTLNPDTISLAVGVAPAPLTKSMLVEPVISGHPAMGYTFTEYSVEPNQVAIQGPSEDLARLSKVRTRPIVINDLRATTSFEVPLDLPSNLKSYSVQRVRVRISIEPKATSGSANQPITVP